jgi:alkylation response protein AidB-like acyl-CoA dehydrogenase
MPDTTSPVATEFFGLPPASLALLEDARRLAAEFAPRAGEVRRHLIHHGEMHPELWAAFREREWPGLVLPAVHGGADGGLLGMSLVLEAFAEQNIMLWMPVLSAAVGHAIAQVGPESLQREWLGRIASGDALLAMAATEPQVGHNLFAPPPRSGARTITSSSPGSSASRPASTWRIACSSSAALRGPRKARRRGTPRCYSIRTATA